jgi:hypothetical protein
LIHVAFFKPGPLGTFLGPTLAEYRPKTKKNLKYIFLFPVLSPSKTLYVGRRCTPLQSAVVLDRVPVSSHPRWGDTTLRATPKCPRATQKVAYAWVPNTCFSGRPGIADFWGLGGPGGPQQLFQKVGGRSAQPFGTFFGAAGAAQTPRVDDLRPAQQPCIKNPSAPVTPMLSARFLTCVMCFST